MVFLGNTVKKGNAESKQNDMENHANNSMTSPLPTLVRNLLRPHLPLDVQDDESTLSHVTEILLLPNDDDGDIEAKEEALASLLAFDDDEGDDRSTALVSQILAEIVALQKRDGLQALTDPLSSREDDTSSLDGNNNNTPRRLGTDRSKPSQLKDQTNVTSVTKTLVSTTQSKAEARKLKRQQRKEAKKSKPKKGAAPTQGERPLSEEPISNVYNTTVYNSNDEEEDRNLPWGGRGRGGRGEYAAKINHVHGNNIHLSDVTVSAPDNPGLELVSQAVLDLQRGHRYGLVGRNGSGKSSLLHALARHRIPGMPADMRILLVQQQVPGSPTERPIDVLLQADVDRIQLLREQEELEAQLEAVDTNDTTTGEVLETTATRLSEIANELDVMDADRAEERALSILQGLQFTPDMLNQPTLHLSGGWRMRLALAKALFVPHCDLLLLDEVTNHMDWHGLDWLIRYLVNNDDSRTLMVVSHDRSFLDAVCTDICHLHHQKLTTHVGNFSEFQRQEEEKAARHHQILDASERQRAKALAFVQKQQQQLKSNADPNKQRQAKMIKDKKLERIGMYREDGKRFQNNSLKKLSMDSCRLAQKVEIEVDEPVIRMHLPKPSWPNSIARGDPIVTMDSFSFGYRVGKDSTSEMKKTPRFLLENNTLNIHRGSKIAVVGRNGSGKSTLMKLIAGDIEIGNDQGSAHVSQGSFWRHQNIRVGHVTQYTVEELEAYASSTVVEYAEKRIRSGKATAELLAKGTGPCSHPTRNIRQYLGAFGLGGRHALQPIGKLSGGERMRLCFATVLADGPSLLLLDESTNHCDFETLDSISRALNNFDGSVVMVSHNQGFLSGFCRELWVIEDSDGTFGGKIHVHHSDTQSFDDLFAAYRTQAMAGVRNGSLVDQRKEQARRAKTASKQKAGTKQKTGFI